MATPGCCSRRSGAGQAAAAASDAAGRRAPAPRRRSPRGAAGVTSGPVKILPDDPDLPALETLVATIARAHRAGEPGRRALRDPGSAGAHAGRARARPGARRGDRIEHGPSSRGRNAPQPWPARGPTVVTQPRTSWPKRGDEYRSDVPADDLLDLWRACSLVDAGIAVAAAPTPPSRADPWLAVRAAIRRRTAVRPRPGPR